MRGVRRQLDRGRKRTGCRRRMRSRAQRAVVMRAQVGVLVQAPGQKDDAQQQRQCWAGPTGNSSQCGQHPIDDSQGGRAKAATTASIGRPLVGVKRQVTGAAMPRAGSGARCYRYARTLTDATDSNAARSSLPSGRLLAPTEYEPWWTISTSRIPAVRMSSR